MNNTSWIRQNWLFFAVLLSCIAARIVFAAGQGFSNDELSALVRTRLSGWNHFWYYGVTFGDMHPALYQALLWCWVRGFGEGEFMVRLPGILFFVFGHWMMYDTLQKHVHKYAGVCFTALIGSLGFLIMHSTFARPYNSGVFFLMLMSCVYIRIKKTGNLSWSDTFLFGLGACGALLSHYFAGLVAFLFIGFTFLIANRTHKKRVCIAGMFGAIVFLPHLNATLLQLGKGGLQWLAPPGKLWLTDTLWLVFNESWFVVVLVLLFFIGLIVHFGIKSRKEGFYELVGFFVAVLLFAYLISWYYTPVLRDLVIVFLLPFLLAGILGSVAFNKSKYFRVLPVGFTVALLMHSFLIYNLMGTEHFGVFKEIGYQINRSVKERGASNITFASNFNNIDYINYYLNEPLKESIIDWDKPDAVKKLSKRIQSSKTPFFAYSFNNAYDHPIFMEMIRQRYPQIELSYFTKGSHFVLFSTKKTALQPIENTLFSSERRVKTSTDEFLEDVKIPAHSLLKSKRINTYYKFECRAKAEINGHVYVVATLEQDETQVLKNGQPLFYIACDQSELVPQEDSFYAAFTLPEDLSPNTSVHFYIWNPEGLKIEVGGWSLKQVILPVNK